MRTAVIGDVHGNLAALDAVLGEVEDARVARICVLGDLALFGPEPAACVDRVRALGERAAFVQGNTDRYVAEQPRPPRSPADGALLDFTASALGEERLAWLAALPTRQVLPEHDALAVHATPASDEGRLGPETPAAEVEAALSGVRGGTVLHGHTHVQYERRVGGFRVINPGAVGLPYDGDRRAAWALLDGARCELRRVAYPVDAVVSALAASSNPARQLTIRRLRQASA